MTAKKIRHWSAKKKNARINELLSFLPEQARIIYKPMVDDIVLVEEKLEALRDKPFLEMNGRGERRVSQAARLYKQLSLQYMALSKQYEAVKGIEVHEEESPLRAFYNRESEREEEK